jgi:hypothetical protein
MHVGGIGTLLRPDGGLDVGTHYGVFLLGAVFTDQGNDIRHGRAREGHESGSLWSFIGVLGWLDRFAGTKLMHDGATYVTASFDAAAVVALVVAGARFVEPADERLVRRERATPPSPRIRPGSACSSPRM